MGVSERALLRTLQEQRQLAAMMAELTEPAPDAEPQEDPNGQTD